MNRAQPTWFLSGAVLLLVAWLSWVGWLSWPHSTPSSPDEAANHFMAQAWARRGSLRVPTGLPPSVLATFHPASLAVRGDELLPGSFVGFVMLQGWMEKFGSAGPLVLTLTVSFLAVLALYRIGRRYWGSGWAVAAAALLTSLPVLIAHQVIPYTQPALYVGLLVLTGLALLRYQERPTMVRAIVLGGVYGLALFIRPVEVLFTGPMIAVVMLARRKYVHVLVAVVVSSLVQVPWMIVAHQTFATYLGSGYTTEGLTIATGHGLPLWKAILTPAGGRWSWYFLTAARDYLLLLYPALSAMSGVALLGYFRRKFTEPVKILKIGIIVLFGLYYLAYYGSWNLYPDIQASRIGSAGSYARYWLPIYVAMVGGTIVFLRKTLNHLPRLAGVVVAGLVLVNLWTWWSHPSGYRAVIAADHQAQTIRNRVLSVTEPNSLVVAGRNGKLLVGYRLTSSFFPQTTDDWQLLGSVTSSRPVYILDLSDPVDAVIRHQSGSTPPIFTEVTKTDDGVLWRMNRRLPSS